MRGIELCAECAYYNMKSHNCTRGCKIDPDSKKGEDVRFFVDCPLPDVQPIKHGRWIEKPPYKDETVKGLEFQIVCSECDEQNCSLEFDENYNAIGKTFYRTRYCPNCGARMIKDGDAK